MKAGMRFEPALYGRGLMSGIVVNDQVKVEIGRGLLVDQLEKTQEFSVPMARHASADDLAVQHVQRREQGRGAIALIVVRHGAGAALLHRQPGLGARSEERRVGKEGS